MIITLLSTASALTAVSMNLFLSSFCTELYPSTKAHDLPLMPLCQALQMCHGPRESDGRPCRRCMDGVVGPYEDCRGRDGLESTFHCDPMMAELQPCIAQSLAAGTGSFFISGYGSGVAVDVFFASSSSDYCDLIYYRVMDATLTLTPICDVMRMISGTECMADTAMDFPSCLNSQTASRASCDPLIEELDACVRDALNAGDFAVEVSSLEDFDIDQFLSLTAADTISCTGLYPEAIYLEVPYMTKCAVIHDCHNNSPTCRECIYATVGTGPLSSMCLNQQTVSLFTCDSMMTELDNCVQPRMSAHEIPTADASLEITMGEFLHFNCDVFYERDRYVPEAPMMSKCAVLSSCYNANGGCKQCLDAATDRVSRCLNMATSSRLTCEAEMAKFDVCVKSAIDTGEIVQVDPTYELTLDDWARTSLACFHIYPAQRYKPLPLFHECEMIRICSTRSTKCKDCMERETEKFESCRNSQTASERNCKPMMEKLDGCMKTYIENEYINKC